MPRSDNSISLLGECERSRGLKSSKPSTVAQIAKYGNSISKIPSPNKIIISQNNAVSAGAIGVRMVVSHGMAAAHPPATIEAKPDD